MFKLVSKFKATGDQPQAIEKNELKTPLWNSCQEG